MNIYSVREIYAWAQPMNRLIWRCSQYIISAKFCWYMLAL